MKKLNLYWLCLAAISICSLNLQAQDFYEDQRQSWIEKAELFKPELTKTWKYPKQLVNIVEDEKAYQGVKAVYTAPIDSLYKVSFNSKSEVIVDFGEHITGYVSFSLAPFDRTPHAPVRLKMTFGEMPCEMHVPFDPYPGTLSRAWLQDEVINIMTVPSTVTIDRRLSFRYVKIELVADPTYGFSITELKCQSVTSVTQQPDALESTVPHIIKQIDKVGLATLRECMQTVYEDGPKRDQRLWVGDLYLESMANNYSYKQYDITKRCLYMFAAISDQSGFLNACGFEEPYIHPQEKQFLLEYAFLFNVTLKDYLVATNDRAIAEDLWPVAKKQLDIARKYLKEDGMMDFERANREWWIHIDWKAGLHKEVSLQGVTIFALKETYELAKLLGKEKEIADVPNMVEKMTKAAKKHFYDKKTGLFVGTQNKQVSYASQIWMVLSGVPTQKEAQRALMALTNAEDVCTPGTPYLYHYYIQALVDANLHREAKESLIDYWGGMIERGADTFWEAYDPKNDYITPYNFYPLNSYCHAWSCTPVYFIRKYPEIFQ